MIGAACLATAAGFAALALSPIPMVRSFGLLLVVGIALAFAVAATGGLRRARPRRPGGRASGRPPRRRRAPDAGWRATPRAPSGARVRAIGKRGARGRDRAGPAGCWPRRWSLAVCGWIAGTRQEVVSDIRELAPSSLPALQDVNELQDETGVSGEMNVVVRADDLTDPEVITWMQRLPGAGARARRLQRREPELRAGASSARRSR